MCSLVTSLFQYACESWTLTAELQTTIWATEMRCYCKIQRTSYKDHVTNKEVCAKIQQAIGLHKDLTIRKRCKLQWYGHVSHSSGLAKTILQGTVKGGRRRGKTTSGNGQAWSSPSPRGQWRTGKIEKTGCVIVFPPLPLSTLSSSPFHCALQDGFSRTLWTGGMTIPPYHYGYIDTIQYLTRKKKVFLFFFFS